VRHPVRSGAADVVASASAAPPDRLPTNAASVPEKSAASAAGLARLIEAFGDRASFQSGGTIIFRPSEPITVKAGMGLRDTRPITFDTVKLHPLRERIKPTSADRLLSALAMSVRQPPKVAKRLCRALTEADFKRLTVLLGWVMMVADGCRFPSEIDELIAALPPDAA